MATRELWLEMAANELRPVFGDYKVPPFRVSMGFPPKGGLSKCRVVGVCCMSEMATDAVPQVYINPTVTALGGANGVLAVLAHEMIHVMGVRGHGKDFAKVGLYIGLEGKMTSTSAGDSLQAVFEHVIKKLGAFPHSPLVGQISSNKPDKCRIIKCICMQCGYTVRVSRKWINLAKPACPICKIDMCDDDK